MSRRDLELVGLGLLLLLLLSGSSSSSSSSSRPIPPDNGRPLEGATCNELGWIWKRKPDGNLWCTPRGFWPF